MSTTRFDVKNVKLFFNGVQVDSGFGSDTAITVTRNEDHVEEVVGTHGDVIVATNYNQTGELRINMQATSTWAKIFREAASVYRNVPNNILKVALYDEATNVKLISDAWPKTQPDVGFGGTPADEEFVFGLNNAGLSYVDAVENVAEIFTTLVS